MLAWISSEISTKKMGMLGMPTHLDWSSLIAAGLSHATGLSDVRCRLPTATLHLPSPTLLSGFLLPTLELAFPCLLPVTSRSRAQDFVWFHAKTDKGIVCLVDHPHSATSEPKWEGPIYESNRTNYAYKQMTDVKL